MSEQPNNKQGYFVHVTVSLVAIGLLIFDLFTPGKVTQTTIELLIIALVPWAAPLFKSVELPGGIKLAFNNSLEEKAADAHLLDSDMLQKVSSFFMTMPAKVDEKNGIKKIGLELNEKLSELATPLGKGSSQSPQENLTALRDNNLIDKPKEQVIQELLNIYNEVSQNKSIRRKTALIFQSVGKNLLESLSTPV